MLPQVLYISAAVALLALNAFFVIAEFALVKVRSTRLKELADEGNKNAAKTLMMMERIDAYLSTCQLGITIASLALGWVGEPAVAGLLKPLLAAMGITSPAVVHSTSVAVGFLTLTALHIVVGEQAPKMFAIRKPETAVLWASRPLRFAHVLAFPFMWVLNASTNLVLKVCGLQPGSEHEFAHSEAELKLLASASHEQGLFTLSRLLMMENVIDFGTLTVDDVMIPLSKTAFLDPSKPWKENHEIVEHTLHSRYPLAGATIDKVVHIKDVAIQLSRGTPPNMNAVARPALRVPPEMPIEEVLKKFMTGIPHMALVEKQGVLLGIVTIEDVLEELVGPINDEFEKVKDYRLSEIVPLEGVLLDVAKASKEALVRSMVQGIAKVRKDVDPVRATTAVMKREALASTGLGLGVAIPHGRVDGLIRPAAAVARARAGGLDFGAIDGKPVNLIFLILSPPHDEGAHLHILEKISSLILSDYLRERMATAETPEAMIEVFRESDKSLPA